MLLPSPRHREAAQTPRRDQINSTLGLLLLTSDDPYPFRVAVLKPERIPLQSLNWNLGNLVNWLFESLFVA